ncbi:LysR family transcriptional regulator [Rhodopseudomonas sp. AAP120]|uniref:LysR family transcriptional regulator n=1 Tax=Rhodopseudomonas sp. AAP120 TaxID=1523430 RepID=UPI0006B8D56F|nr:LysR family transcriptional regulator [Rhodopseudomonas sp. AAP120]KPG01398.1 LysR family transcriptional regulator [Rhodopseudomonas sp. AAP120]
MDRSAVTIERIRTFVRVAERGSLSAVARELNVGQSTVTRQLQELESAIGAALLSRTTRRVTLTEEGSRYYTRAVQILRLLEQAGDEALGSSGAPAGAIRMTCTASFGVMHASRLIFAFQDRFPEIGIDFGLTDQRIDLVREGVDLALRLAPLTESSLKLRTLGQSQRLMAASPDYLAAHGRPMTPQDLSRHQGIRMVNVAGSDMLTFEGPGQEIHRVPFGGRLRVDHGLAAREAMIAGRGIAATHRWLVDDLLAAGRLEVILPDYRLPPVPLNLLIVPERAGIARVRLLIDFLVEQIRAVPGIE